MINSRLFNFKSHEEGPLEIQGSIFRIHFYPDYGPTGVVDLNAEKRGGGFSQGHGHVSGRFLAHYKKSPVLQ